MAKIKAPYGYASEPRECINCGNEFRLPLDKRGTPQRRKTCSKECQYELVSWEAIQRTRALQRNDPEMFKRIYLARDFRAMAQKSGTRFTSESGRRAVNKRWYGKFARARAGE